MNLNEALKCLEEGIITTVSLYDENIGDDGAKKVALALEKNSTLTEIDLSCEYNADGYYSFESS